MTTSYVIINKIATTTTITKDKIKLLKTTSTIVK